MGNRQRKKAAAAEFNAARTAEIERREQERREYEMWAETPEGRAELQRRRAGRSVMRACAALALGSFR